jgi:hypothetical protein
MTNVVRVSRSFTHSHEECSLAEDYEDIAKVKALFDLLEKAVMRRRAAMSSTPARDTFAALELGLFELRNDSCLNSTYHAAEEAFIEVPTVRVIMPTVPK